MSTTFLRFSCQVSGARLVSEAPGFSRTSSGLEYGRVKLGIFQFREARLSTRTLLSSPGKDEQLNSPRYGLPKPRVSTWSGTHDPTYSVCGYPYECRLELRRDLLVQKRRSSGELDRCRQRGLGNWKDCWMRERPWNGVAVGGGCRASIGGKAGKISQAS